MQPSNPLAETSLTSLVTAAAIRPRRRSTLLNLCLPLLAACAILAAGHGLERLAQARAPRNDRRFGLMKQSQAVALATDLCSRIAGSPAEALDSRGFTNGPGDRVRQFNVWQVWCRAGVGRYYLRIDTDHQEVALIQREQEAATSGDIAPGNARPEHGDLPAGGISPREAKLWARRYLRLVGLPLPSDARLVRNPHRSDFIYECSGPSPGLGRHLSVSIDPQDGSLEHLQNVVYRRHQAVAP
jgi:hypothetical protein